MVHVILSPVTGVQPPSVRLILPQNLPLNPFYNFLNSSNSFSLPAIGFVAGLFAQAAISRGSSLKSRIAVGVVGLLLSGIFQQYIKDSEGFKLYTKFKRVIDTVQAGLAQDPSRQFPDLLNLDMLACDRALDTKYHQLLRDTICSSVPPRAYEARVPETEVFEISSTLLNNRFYNFLHSYRSFPLSVIGFVAAFLARAAINRESSLKSRVMIGVVGFLLTRIFQRCIKRSTDYKLYKQFRKHVANGRPLSSFQLSRMLPCNPSFNTKYHAAILAILHKAADRTVLPVSS